MSMPQSPTSTRIQFVQSNTRLHAASVPTTPTTPTSTVESKADTLAAYKRAKKQGSENLDILALHEKVLALMDAEYASLPTSQTRLARYKWILDNSTDPVERHIAFNEHHKLSTTIDNIESGIREAKYLYATESLIGEYTSILEKPVKVDFMKKAIPAAKSTRKQEIIEQFCNIAKEYIEIPIIHIPMKKVVCKDCGLELQKDDDYLFVCKECGYAIKQLANTNTYLENNRINVAQRYVYDKRSHFGDSIKKFQGKQNTTIPQQVYADIYEKIRSHAIPIDRVNKDQIYEFLKLTNWANYYEDITLIYTEITHRPAPDISALEQALFSLFDEVVPVYERVKPPERTNFLNGQFVLFKLLQKLRYPCREEDFYILKTRDKMLEHDCIWKKICNELSWTFVPTV